VPDLANIPEVDGRYAIEREIGHGGMGRVFSARDVKLDREVAVKILTGGVHSAEQLRRFEQEARTAGSLDHPNVLVVHDVGATEKGPYIVTELLRGATLRERMRGKPLQHGKAIDYALQLAQGLRAAHHKGIVHRDLKPENLFITHEGRLKILDFGIAKLVERPDPKPITDETIVGTVAYMSPEQVRGQRADTRSDIFAFGSILYEMLSGHRAFDVAGEIATGAAIIIDDPPPLPADVPRGLEGIVWRCLEKDPKDRFQSADDLLVELSGQHAGRPRRIWLVLSLVAVAGALLAAVFGGLMPRRLPVDRSSIAVLPFVNLSGDQDNEYFSEGIAEELINALANVEGLRVASRTSSFAFKGKKASVAEIGQQLSVGTVVEGSVRRDGNRLRVAAQLIDVADGFHVWSNIYDRESKNVLSVEDELAHSIAQALRPSLAQAATPLLRATTASTEAHDLYLRARYFWNDRTEPALTRAIALYKRAVELDPTYARAHAGLADSYILFRNYAPKIDPRELMAKAKLHARKALEADDTLAEAHTSLGLIAEFEFDWKTSEREHRRSIEMKPDYARAHHWYGLLLRDLGRFAESDAEFARALQLEPTSKPIIIVSALNSYYRRDFDRAIERLNGLLEIGADAPTVHAVLSASYMEKAHYAEAVATIDKAIGADGDTGWLGVRGFVHARAGDRAGAMAVLAGLEKRAQREFVPPASLAMIHSGLGDKERAFALLDDAYAAGDGTLMALKVEPLWDSLRPDPRFESLLARLKFE
jgi:serine/threonine-protein kinase